MPLHRVLKPRPPCLCCALLSCALLASAFLPPAPRPRMALAALPRRRGPSCPAGALAASRLLLSSPRCGAMRVPCGSTANPHTHQTRRVVSCHPRCVFPPGSLGRGRLLPLWAPQCPASVWGFTGGRLGRFGPGCTG